MQSDLPSQTNSSLESKVSKRNFNKKLKSVKDFVKSDDGKIISIVVGIPVVGGAIIGYTNSKGIIFSENDPRIIGSITGIAFGAPYAFFTACNKNETDSTKETLLGSGIVGVLGGTLGALGYSLGYSVGKYLF